MGVTVVPSAITGQTLSAADWNTQVRDNINGIWVLTTAGDMLYATGASAAARLALVTGGIMYGGASAPAWLALGSAHTFLKSEGGSAPKYGSLIYKRQGGSSTVWSTPGTTSYTPTTTLMQSGIKNVAISAGIGTADVTYPTAFSQRPIPILSANIDSASSYLWGLGWTDDTVSGFRIHMKFDGAYSGTIAVAWLSIGA